MKNSKRSLALLLIGASASVFAISSYAAGPDDRIVPAATTPAKVAFDAQSTLPPQLVQPNDFYIIQTPVLALNIGQGFSSATSQFTVPATGVYQVNATIGLDSGGQVCPSYILSLFLNGAEARRLDRSSGGGQFGLSGSTLFHLTKGDVLDMRLFHTCLGIVVIEADAKAYFNGARIY